jgi:hypothetical protein
MNDAYTVNEVNLLRNVQAPDSKSSVSKEFAGLKRKRMKDNKKKGSGGHGSKWSSRGQGHTGYEKEPPENSEQEGKIDITI